MRETALYFIFRLDGQSYGIALSFILKVFRRVELIRIPHAPEALMGLININGKMIPVMNIRQYLQMPPGATKLSDRLVCIRLGDRRIAVIVDAIEGIFEIPAEAMDTSEGVFDSQRHFITGVSVVNHHNVICIRIEDLIPISDLSPIEHHLKAV